MLIRPGNADSTALYGKVITRTLMIVLTPHGSTWVISNFFE